MRKFNRCIAFFLCFVISFSAISSVANASWMNYGLETLWAWITGSSSEPLGGWTPVGWYDSLFSVNQPQKYYTTPTSSVQDKYGNVTN